MNRRDFLKSALTIAAFAPMAKLAAKAGLDGDKTVDAPSGAQVTRRRYKNSNLMLPLLGFGMMRLPQITPDKPEIDYPTAEKMIARAMKAGVNYFDTAYMYHSGLSEKCVGDILSKYPRDSYYLADKMPCWMAGSEAGLEKVFQEQLARTKAGYFDFYLIHSLDASGWELAQKFHAYEFLAKKKAEGKIRKLGFSFHDSPEVLQKIASAHPWDFAQLQLNYLDWEIYRSKEQYEILTKLGIPVTVMEPLRGGTLASLTPGAVGILKKANPEAGTASWALRWAASLPNVLVVLSGMTLPEHVEDNIRTFTPFRALSDSERKTLAEALPVYRKSLAVPCTGCRYCMPCPAGVEIPRIFALYNQYRITGNSWLFLSNYKALPDDAKASECVRCGKCMKHCPQHIRVPDELAKIEAEIERLQGKTASLFHHPDETEYV